MIIQGDCLEKLKELDENSIDAIVTDPPYELGFMGKGWDKTGIANNVEMWSECLRVLKPGGHLLSFGGTRTYHRMASAIEDAGFEVRDMIEWVYGSGFPKSLNIGKAVDKLQGNEREFIGINSNGLSVKNGNTDLTNNRYSNKDGILHITKGTSEWEGWGTALKPAHEPICMARKPLLEKTVAENCLKWGTGGINIDESRVEAAKGDKFGGGGLNSPVNGFMGNTDNTYKKGTGFRDDTHLGRFPANLIHDNSEEVRECFPDSKTGSIKPYISKDEGMFGMMKGKEHYNSHEGDSGNASRFFKSIIYQSKASKRERNEGCEGLKNEKFTAGNYSQSPVCKTCDKTLNGTNNHSKCSGEVYYREMESKKTANNHPTVKPVKLMEYLINMVTREGQIVLDPFAGSGTTGVACKNLGRDFILIERESQYVEIIKARVCGNKP